MNDMSVYMLFNNMGNLGPLTECNIDGCYMAFYGVALYSMEPPIPVTLYIMNLTEYRPKDSAVNGGCPPSPPAACGSAP